MILVKDQVNFCKLFNSLNTLEDMLFVVTIYFKYKRIINAEYQGPKYPWEVDYKPSIPTTCIRPVKMKPSKINEISKLLWAALRISYMVKIG